MTATSQIPSPLRTPSRSPGAGPNILFVDDEPLVRRAFQRTMRTAGFTVTTAADAAEALRLYDEVRPDLVVTDLNMPGMNGLELIEEMHDRFGARRFIVMSGVGVIETSCRVPCVRYCEKPWRAERVLAAVREVTLDTPAAAAC